MIRWELNPFTCNLVRNDDLIRSLRWTSRIRWRYSENVKPAIDIVPEIGNSHCRVLGLALRHDCKNTMQIRLKTTPKKISDCDNRVKTKIFSCRGSWLSPSPYENKCRYRNVRPHSLPAESHSFVGMARETAAMPPARRRREKKKKERLYIYSDATHTHLLRNILSNYWCGMHRTCKNTSVKPDRRHWMIRSEKLCEVILSMFWCIQ